MPHYREPLQNLYEDVPKLLTAFLLSLKTAVATYACRQLDIACDDYTIRTRTSTSRKKLTELKLLTEPDAVFSDYNVDKPMKTTKKLQRKGGGSDRGSAPRVPKKKLSKKKKQEQEQEPEEEEEEEAKEDLKKKSQRKRRPTPRYISDESSSTVEDSIDSQG